MRTRYIISAFGLNPEAEAFENRSRVLFLRWGRRKILFHRKLPWL